MTGVFYVPLQSNGGVEWTPNKSQYTKLTLERKILPPLLPEFELATFRSRVRRSIKKPSRSNSTGLNVLGWEKKNPVIISIVMSSQSVTDWQQRAYNCWRHFDDKITAQFNDAQCSGRYWLPFHYEQNAPKGYAVRKQQHVPTNK